MLEMARGGPAGLRLRVFGVPVAIHPTLPLVLALLGLSAGSVGRVAIWVGLGLVAVLLHEMGHAAAAIALGGRPSVVLAGLGGLTRPGIERPLGRLQLIGLAVAGPAAGLVLGGLVAVGVALFGRPADPTADFAVVVALWVNIGWSVVNLLPVVPLDGGHVLTQILPGDLVTRNERAHLVSALVGAVATVVLFRYGLVFAAVMFAFLAVSAFGTYRRLGASRDRVRATHDLAQAAGRLGRAGDDGDAEVVLRRLIADDHVGASSRSLLVEHLARDHRAEEARALLDDLTGVPPTLAFLVEVLDGADEVDSLVEAFRRGPDPVTARHVVLGLVAAERTGRAVPLLRQVPERPDRPALLASAQLAAHEAEAFDLSAEIGALTYELHPESGPLVAYNTACSLARAGQPDEALQWLEAAVERGFDEVRLLEGDADLASLRERAEFTDLHARVRSRA